MTIEQAAIYHNVCLLDLLRVNGFPDSPLATEIELFIPPARSCPEDITARKVTHTELHEIAFETNICPEILLELNPHFEPRSLWWELTNRLFFSGSMPHWIVVPTHPQPCFQEHKPSGEISIYELEQQLNVCYEAFIREVVLRFYMGVAPYPDKFYTRIDASPCYNALGQRQFFDPDGATYDPLLNKPAPSYTNMPIYRFRSGDTVYSISQHYNVCVRDLLRVNPTLKDWIPTDYSVFIPQTRPCYNQISRLPLIYEDETGNPLPEPRTSDQLIYYGGESLGHISRYYNVCVNRIEDANRDKLTRERSYLGWIIPTDRPPCYDADGFRIEYVCYDQPIDFTLDYRSITDEVSFDMEGDHCYDLAAPETVVWYHNKPYQIVKHREQEIFSSRAFMAWCFGVSLDEINAINDDPVMLAMMPYYTRAIPRQTRECYVQNPRVLEVEQTIHIVQKDETVSSIAAQYDKLPHWIARANDLNEDNMIWIGQNLIIPGGLALRELVLLVCAVTGAAASCGLIYVRRPKSLAGGWE